MKETYVEGIGLVRMTKNGRAVRNYNFKVKPDGSVFVSIPPGGSYHRAIENVHLLKDKIVKKQKQLEKKQLKPVLYEYKTYNSRLFSIHISAYDGDTFKMSNKNNDVYISIPRECLIDSDEVQTFIQNCMKEVWRFEAKKILPQRLDELAKQNSFQYRLVKINSAVTRWGSCSSQNNINLSLYLMKLPDELCDYVILHELCHTVHKNHSSRFYNLLNKVTKGKHPQLNNVLKNYRPGF